MDSKPREALERALGVRVEAASPVAGGDINEAWDVRLSDGRRVFAKTHANAAPQMFPAEARGLEWLRAAGALRVPKVLAAEAQVLALERIESAPRRAGFDEELGRGLAALHRFGAPSFGLDHDNFIGRLPQPNAPLPSFSDFYRERRLGAQLRAARRAGLVDAALEHDFDRLFARLPDLCGPAEAPARLHGDLWGGNLHVDEHGAPCLIDPAVYGGHREVDLAMMRLFGGFSPRVFAAYEEAYPLAPGAAERVPLHQLYPLLVHVNLFGGGYVGSVRRVLARYV